MISDYEEEKKKYEARVQSLASDLGDKTNEAKSLRNDDTYLVYLCPYILIVIRTIKGSK